MNYYYIIALVLSFNVLFAQKDQAQQLKFQLKMDTTNLPCESYIHIATGDSIRIDELKFYISNLSFLYKGKIVYSEKQSYHLIDINDNKSILLHCNFPKNKLYDQLAFNLGIDSITNVSGAMGGDLDPTKGMYWSWQSGYINLKLEGKSTRSTDPKKEFQYHLGGYQYPFNALKTVALNVVQKKTLTILFDVKEFLLAANIKSLHHIMSPNTDAIRLSDKAAHCFYVK